MQKTGRQTDPGKVRETIVQNAQKGQMYRLIFADDPVIYEGMPITQPGMTADDENVFEIKLIGPSSREGDVLRRSINDITWIEEYQ